MSYVQQKCWLRFLNFNKRWLNTISEELILSSLQKFWIRSTKKLDMIFKRLIPKWLVKIAKKTLSPHVAIKVFSLIKKWANLSKLPKTFTQDQPMMIYLARTNLNQSTKANSFK